MQRTRLVVLAMAAVAAMTLGAQAAGNQGGFVRAPETGQGYPAAYGICWWEYVDVPKYVYVKVRTLRNGKVAWKSVRKLRYQSERQYFCSYPY